MEVVGGLVIPRRFRGPSDSGNGGYVVGRLASFAPGNVRVRLLRAPPLDVPLEVVRLPDDALLLRQGETVIADARPHDLQLDVPRPPDYLEAMEASLACAITPTRSASCADRPVRAATGSGCSRAP